MDDPAKAAAQLEEEAEKLMTFIGARRLPPGDRIILVMGLTGTGKSTFVARCTGREVDIGHNLFSCTDSISIFDYVDDDGQRVYLIDTPGFDDTHRSDVETLQLLGTYLSVSYTKGVRIDGVIVLQRITDPRMSGASVRFVELLLAMCDLPSYARFAIVTTMWPEKSSRSDSDYNLFAARERSFYNNERYFGSFKDALQMRHAEHGRGIAGEEARSARRIVARLLKRTVTMAPIVLRFQRELSQDGLTLEETLAGQVLHRDISRRRQECMEQIAEHKDQIAREEQAQCKRPANVDDLRGELLDLAKQVSRANGQLQALQASVREMYDQEKHSVYRRIDEVEEGLFKKFQEKQQRAVELETLVRQREENSAQQELDTETERLSTLRRRVTDWSAAVSVSVPSSTAYSMPGVSTNGKMQQLDEHPLTDGKTRRLTKKQPGDQASEPSMEATRRKQDQQEMAALKRELEELRTDRDKYRESYGKFKETKSGVRTSVVSGLSAGLASGAVAAAAAAHLALCSVM